MKRKTAIIYIACCLCIMTLCSCYHRPVSTSDALVQYNERQRDSISFSSTHHYTNNYNFIIKSDSIVLFRQQPEEILSGLETDSFTLKKNTHIVVADIRFIPTDPNDSVWIQLASDNHQFGWIQESKMLEGVIPDDPISAFISYFSDTHLLVFMCVIAFISIVYWIRRLLKENAPIVHFNDINSFYPTLLCMLVALSACLYASIQMFEPDVWRHFYYHPTLNPFSTPPLLSVFLVSIWTMLITALAAIDDVRKELSFGNAILYLSGLMAVCAANYIIFSLSTLYYLGYILLSLYLYFALISYFKHRKPLYTCGNCGYKLEAKGQCPKCGAINK